jgi:RluA family pseudouridine synthase
MLEVPEQVQAPRARQRPQPENGPLSIVYEDDWLLVLDKPAGQVVHPTYRNWSGTLLNAVLWHLRDRHGAQPGILTRLDRDTSGLVVVGATAEAHARMQKDGLAGRVRKQYLAVVHGAPAPPDGRIVLPLGRSPDDRRRVVVTAGGAYAETRYETVAAHGDSTLVRCELVTGRTHQIRVHLADSGWPIVGDRQYGCASDAIGRQALHAWRVSLPHPITREPLEVESPVPADMQPLVAPQNTTP